MAFKRIFMALALIATTATSAIAFEASFDFSNVRACAGGVLRITPSPAFKLTDVPAGTAALDFALLDLTINYAHGGRQIDYAGQPTIDADTFKYVGPCPDVDVTHTYEWTIRALDGTNTELGVAKAQAEFTGSRP